MLNFLINSAQAAATLPTFNQGNLPEFVGSVYSFALTIVGIAVFFRILQAGFLWFTAAGNASKASDAMAKIKGAVIGAIILFAAWLILFIINPDLVKSTFSFNLPPGNRQNFVAPVTTTSRTGGSATLAGLVNRTGATSSANPSTRSTSSGQAGSELVNSAHAEEGFYFFTVRVTDANGDYYDQDYSMEVLDRYALNSRQIKKTVLSGRAVHNPKIARAVDEAVTVFISTQTVPDAVINEPYFTEIKAAGGVLPYTYSLVDGSSSFWPINKAKAANGLPDGISLYSTMDMPILTIQNKTAQRIPASAFNQTDRFLLEVSNAQPNSDLYFKWIKNGTQWYYPGKTPNQLGWTLYGRTDDGGRWRNEANFTAEQIGTWAEYVLIAGAVSRPINFQVVAEQVVISTSSSVQSSGFSFTPCVATTFCENTETGEQTDKLTDEEINQLQKTGQDLSGDRCPGGREVTVCSYPSDADQRDCSSVQFDWRNCAEEADPLRTSTGSIDTSGLPYSATSDPADASANPGELFTADGTPFIIFDESGNPYPNTTVDQTVTFCKYSDQVLAINCGMPMSGEYCASTFRGVDSGLTVDYCAPLLQ
ncbi:MAG: pilin [Patescibacteria group bacterium]